MDLFNLRKRRAQKLHRAAQELHDNGDSDAAIESYLKAIELDPTKSETFYNLGLIYKYKSEWEKSLQFNIEASRLRPDDEASRWNLAIAATALRKWNIARNAWRDNGIELDGDAGSINMNFGITPVRINPNGSAEVVWARRIDPVRAIIESIPFPESGFHYADIVLHDGVPIGYRKYQDSERPVFNVLELFEASKQETFVVYATASEKAIESLEAALSEIDGAVEDWSTNIRTLCKECSEGKPYESHSHEHEAKEIDPNNRKFGISVPKGVQLQAILDSWKTSNDIVIHNVE
jgi:tetratricopeptide (TPR) repeat protein